MHPPHHAALRSYLARNGIESGESREDGAVELVFDETYRVHCRPAPLGCLVFETVLASVPPDAAGADDLLIRALNYAAERLDATAEGPVLSEDERSLLLQQHIAADAGTEEFEQGLEDFANAIAAWRRHLCVL